VQIKIKDMPVKLELPDGRIVDIWYGPVTEDISIEMPPGCRFAHYGNCITIRTNGEEKRG